MQRCAAGLKGESGIILPTCLSCLISLFELCTNDAQPTLIDGSLGQGFGASVSFFTLFTLGHAFSSVMTPSLRQDRLVSDSAAQDSSVDGAFPVDAGRQIGCSDWLRTLSKQNCTIQASILFSIFVFFSEAAADLPAPTLDQLTAFLEPDGVDLGFQVMLTPATASKALNVNRCDASETSTSTLIGLCLRILKTSCSELSDVQVEQSPNHSETLHSSEPFSSVTIWYSSATCLLRSSQTFSATILHSSDTFLFFFNLPQLLGDLRVSEELPLMLVSENRTVPKHGFAQIKP